MNTCRLNLLGLATPIAPGVNRTLRVFGTSPYQWELEDSFQLQVLRGNCFYGHEVSREVNGMVFCPLNVHPRDLSDVLFKLEYFTMLPDRPVLRRGQGAFLNRGAAPTGRLRLEASDFHWEVVDFT